MARWPWWASRLPWRNRRTRECGRCSSRCSKLQMVLRPRAMTLLQLLAHAPGRVHDAARPARAARRRLNTGGHPGRRAAWHPRRAPAPPGCADRLARQRRPDDSQPRHVRLPAATAVHRRPRRARGHLRADSLRAAADRPHDNRRTSLGRSRARRSRHRDGHDARSVAAPGRAATGAAVNRRRDSRGRGDRRRHGDHRGGGWRWRAWRIHFPRPVDGRFDRHPRRRGPLGRSRPGD